MKYAFRAITASLALGTSLFAGEPDPKTITPPQQEENWKLALSSPAWLAGIKGDVGINGMVSHVNVDPGTVIRHIDMTASARAELSKGRFGVMADFLYLSLSDGIGTPTMVKKVDLQLDQILAELALRWRVIESPRGSLDVIAGVRYNNLFQQVTVQPNSARIEENSNHLVEAVSTQLARDLSESGLRELIRGQFPESIPTFDPNRPSTLPIGPLGGALGGEVRERIAKIIQAKKDALKAALLAKSQATTAAAKAAAQDKVNEIQRQLSRRITKAVESKLDTSIGRTDYWLDPFVGLRGRYDLTDRIYTAFRGDVGGFTVGADFAWQVEGLLGYHVSKNLFVEAGYRALGTNYNQNGLKYAVVTHGAELNLGFTF